jgi:hypothetical protein
LVAVLFALTPLLAERDSRTAQSVEEPYPAAAA